MKQVGNKRQNPVLPEVELQVAAQTLGADLKPEGAVFQVLKSSLPHIIERIQKKSQGAKILTVCASSNHRQKPGESTGHELQRVAVPSVDTGYAAGLFQGRPSEDG